MSRHIAAVVMFNDLTINASKFDDYGCMPPRTLFEIEQDKNGTCYCYYPEADESFEGKTIQEVVDKIKKFQESDETVSDIGEVEIKMIKKSKIV